MTTSLNAQAAAQVCKIASALATNEAHVLVTPPLLLHQNQNQQQQHEQQQYGATQDLLSSRTKTLGSALVSLFQTPTQALAHTLFGTSAATAGDGEQDTPRHGLYLHPMQSTVLLRSSKSTHDTHGSRQAMMVWLSWDDCRCLAHVFRYFEYVDALGKPTSLVDTLVSRLTAGEAAKSPAMGRQGSSEEPDGARSLAAGGSDSNGGGNGLRLWGWGPSAGNGSSNNDTGDAQRMENNGSAAMGTSNAATTSTAGTHSDEQVRTAAWQLLSNIFARATALRLSAEAEEVAESDVQAVLTWFPRLEFLDSQSIPHAALRFWDTWMPGRLTCLKVEYAGLALDTVLGLRGESGVEPEHAWSRLALLDLSRNPGIDLSPLGSTLPHLLPHVSRLSLACCELESVPASLVKLYNLSWLDLRGNAITSVADISLKLGSVVQLDLSDNRIDDVAGLHRLWALETLDISNNLLDAWTAILALRNMPSLSSLDVRGNPFTQNNSESYRPQIFSAFDHRDVPLVLDGRGPTSRERRAMAKIPRVATGHRIGAAVAATPGVPAKKMHRPKVAVIEEAVDDGADSDDGDVGNENGNNTNGEYDYDYSGRHVDGPESVYTAGSSPHEPKDASSPISDHLLVPAEKITRVLRATELMAAHRRTHAAARSNPPSLATSASLVGPQLISMKPRTRVKRRATATTLGGILGSATPPPPAAATTARGSAIHDTMAMPRSSTAAADYYFAASSYGGRPASPVPSSVAPSVRTRTSILRDPERYRRRVEMMRAEAGSSWLRAFAELQLQSREASPTSPVVRQGAQFGQPQPSATPFGLVSTHDSFGSGSDGVLSDTREEPYLPSSVRQITDDSNSDSDPSRAVPDTVLPSFLFPRRKPVVHKKDIPRLPHYSPDEKAEDARGEHGENEAASLQQEEAEAVGLGIVDSDDNLLGSATTSARESPRGSSSQDSLAAGGLLRQGSGKEGTAHARTRSQQLDEIDKLRKGEGVSAALNGEGVRVAHYGFMPIVETPYAGDQGVPLGSRVVQRRESSGQSVYITAHELIEAAAGIEDPGSPTDNTDVQQIASRAALVQIVRIKSPSDNSILVELKDSRFESPRWIEYMCDTDSTARGFSVFADALAAICDDNSRQGLSERVYKQAECLRCSWHGSIDHERTSFEMLPSDKQFILFPPPPTELQCPQCKRKYLREFYASDEERSSNSGGAEETQKDVEPIWKQSFVSRRNRPVSARRSAKEAAGTAEALAARNEHRARRAKQITEAKELAQREIERLGGVAVRGSLPFSETSNAIELFLQLSVFEADGERLKRWVPAGLVRQAYPLVPEGRQAQGTRPPSSSNRGATSNSAGNKPPSGSKWGFSAFLGGTAISTASGDAEKDELLEGIPEHERRAHVIQSDWRASAALAPDIVEQAVCLALSSHAIYVFSLTWDALTNEAADAARRAEMDLRPEQHLGLLFSIPLAALGRIDIGPNRQYLALHSSLLTLEDKGSKQWGSKNLHPLLSTAHAAYPAHASASDPGALADARSLERSVHTNGYIAKTSALRAAQQAPRYHGTHQSKVASSCVFLIRDRLACSDLLDSLVEIGYETKVLNSDAAGIGSGRLRAINHDVEWAMHHLVQQVFLRPTAFDEIDDDTDSGEGHSRSGAGDLPAKTVDALSTQLVMENRKRALRILQKELLRSPSSKQPGALVDASSGDNVIVDKVTYEFLKLYFCVGCVLSPTGEPGLDDRDPVSAAAPASTAGILPLTLVASPQFLYLVRERVDVWPPPVPDLRLLYHKWQRIAPPTIVTSDPDTYDPQALTEELARRSNAPSSASTATSRPVSAATSAANSVGNHESGSSTVRDDMRPMIAGIGAGAAADPAHQLMSSAINQYDTVVHARPITDICQITLLSMPVAVLPQQRLPASPPASASNEKQPQSSSSNEVLGCTGSSWHAMVHIKFAAAKRGSDSTHDCAADDADMCGWRIWFATHASAEECVEALSVLTKSAGVAGVEVCLA
ncbi:hypothetical protein GGI11_000769 [Coemansia sp. RSA 2049]|nr:hypothetical protein GGI11_000769 [Coemansia sp. RSA 2049]